MTFRHGRNKTVIDSQLAVFAVFAITSQAILLSFFMCRRWRRDLADRYGWIAYAFGVLGLAVGIWLFIVGAPWQLFVGPILYAIWAAYGAWADLFRRIEWRPSIESVVERQPVRWSVLGPYITLYFAAQMFLWWPLWDRWQIGWMIYLVLFVANTGLNIAGHFGSRRTSTPRAA